LSKHIMPAINKAEITEKFEKDYFAKLLGIEIIEIECGFARVRMTITEQMLNSLGKTHGGALFAAADFALAVASNSYGEAAVSTNVSINYIKASSKGSVIDAVATEESRTRKTGLYRIEVVDETGRKLALAHGSVYLLNQTF
jgi:acyl-CoA thioesterase